VPHPKLNRSPCYRSCSIGLRAGPGPNRGSQGGAARSMMRFRASVPIAETRKRLFWHLALVLGYVLTGRLALLLAVPPGYATAIFPPAGIAMTAALIGGRNALPGIFIGSFILNLWIGSTVDDLTASLFVAVALMIAAASLAQAALGAWSLRRLIGYPMPLDNVRDLGLFLLISPAICTASVTLSLGGMAGLSAISISQISSNWFAWWIGDTLGVLFFLPLIMVLAGEPRALWRTRARTVALPMLLCFALFVAIFVRTREWEQGEALTEFRLLSQGFLDRLQFQLAAQEDFLQQLGAFWTGPERITHEQFGTLTRHLLRRFPAIRAVEWAPRVAAADRSEFEEKQRQEVAQFAIREAGSRGSQVPAGDRIEYYPVAYVEPLRGNEAALGLDLASDPVRATAIHGTSRTGVVTATAPIALVQDPDNRTGALLTLAVSPGPNGAGVLLFVLKIDKCVEAQLGPARQMVEVQVVDRQANQQLFGGLVRGAYADRYTRTIPYGGRSYDVTTAPTKLYLARHQGWQSWAVLVVGVLGTSLLGALLMLSTGERHRFARLLMERTRERNRIWQVSEDLLGVSNFEGYFTSVNPAWTKTLGWTEEEIETQHVNQLRHPDDVVIGTEARRRLAEGAGTVRLENRFRHKDGSYRWIYWTLTAEQGLIYVIGRNITADKEAAQAHRQTEEQLHQLQKMDAVGQLTGGIAHDFNNLLTVILGNLEILERILQAPSERVIKAVKSAMDGATRAATLTQRLLAYAQRQPLRPRGVDLNELVTGMRDLICRTHGEAINYEFALDQARPLCFCDANQLETALLNLVINARDAMESGGRLKVETSIVSLDQTGARIRDVSPGPYAMLSVSDTGVGMSRETVEHAFEPFFTTKEVGRGTGLGLSMVYGFAKQSNGHADIESSPGRGTTVRILLPALAGGEATDVQAVERRPVDASTYGNGETILVVEDDTGVRQHVVDTLRTMSYAVVEAEDAAAALAIIRKNEAHIDMLLTDIVMPGMNGRELANRARALMPNIRILFMTGYSQDVMVHHGRLDGDIELIEKPFLSEALAARVRTMFDTNTETV
jgi:PAS domain S-box-containing protein